MKRRGVRHRCGKQLRELFEDPRFPRPFSVDVFCELIAEQRERPLHLHALMPTDTDTPSGMWWTTDHADHVFYDARTSHYQQQLIIFHEIGHMLLDHQCPDIEDNEYLTARLDDDPDRIRQIMSRIRYTSREEQEAEQVATLIRDAVSNLADPSPHPGLLGRLETALGFQRRTTL